MWRSSVRTRAGLRIVRVEGHVDAASESVFHRRLHDDVTGGDATLIYLDLRAVSFLGASGAAVLIAAAFAGRAAGRSVILGRCSPSAVESLARTGALDLLRPHDRGPQADDLAAPPAERTSGPVEHRSRRPVRAALPRALQPS